MRNRLKILFVIGAIVTLPLALKAEDGDADSDDSGYSVTEDYGDGMKINRPITREDIEKARARREKSEDDKRSKRNAEAAGHEGFFSPEAWTSGLEGEGSSGEYWGGQVRLSSESVKAQKQNMMSDGLAQMGAISQGASSMTKDPRTAGVVMATGSALGAASSLVNAAGYSNLSSQYEDVRNQNQAKADANRAEIERMQAAHRSLMSQAANLSSTPREELDSATRHRQDQLLNQAKQL